MEAPGPAPLHWQSRLSVVRLELCPFQSQMPPRMDIPLPLWALTPVFGHPRGENKTTRRNSDDKSPCGTLSPSSLAAPLHLHSCAPSAQAAVLRLPGQPHCTARPVPGPALPRTLLRGQLVVTRRAGAVGGCQVLLDAVRCLPAASALCVSGLMLQGLGVSGLGAEGSAEGSKSSAGSGKGQTQAAGGTSLEQPLITEKSIHCRQQLKA